MEKENIRGTKVRNKTITKATQHFLGPDSVERKQVDWRTIFWKYLVISKFTIHGTRPPIRVTPEPHKTRGPYNVLST